MCSFDARSKEQGFPPSFVDALRFELRGVGYAA